MTNEKNPLIAGGQDRVLSGNELGDVTFQNVIPMNNVPQSGLLVIIPNAVFFQGPLRLLSCVYSSLQKSLTFSEPLIQVAIILGKESER